MSHVQTLGDCLESDQLSCSLHKRQPFGNRLMRAAALLHTWHQRARQRRELQQLDTRMLRDMGKTRLQARDEWRKPFWRE